VSERDQPHLAVKLVPPLEAFLPDSRSLTVASSPLCDRTVRKVIANIFDDRIRPRPEVHGYLACAVPFGRMTSPP